ncbi:hypothetical protein GEV33_010122 [Tenebrio molitor]|uniref:Uncharacterized protein n=1 Tax=Tenebrio molitor TaxID=7067 RepID=A0A8J6HDB8_TENMO|nr:hypothetical protein GEV33_010122 [Tenebrio molitor]
MSNKDRLCGIMGEKMSAESEPTWSQPRHLPGVEPEFPETESTGTHPEPTRKPIGTRPESIRSSPEPPGADPEPTWNPPGAESESPEAASELTRNRSATHPEPILNSYLKLTRSRPGTHPEPTRKSTGIRPESTQRPPEPTRADPGPTRSQTGIDSEPSWDAPGAESKPTRSQTGIDPEPSRDSPGPIRKSTGIRPESTRGPPEPTRVDSELTGTDPEPIRNLLGADPEPTRNRQRAPIFQKDNRPGLSKKTAVVDLWNVRASC